TTIYTVVPGHQLLGRPLDEVIADTRIEAQKMFDRLQSNAPAQKLFAAMTTDEQLKSAAESRIKLQAALASVATSTGGWTMFLEHAEDTDDIDSSIFSDLNGRYIVDYYTSNLDHGGER